MKETFVLGEPKSFSIEQIAESGQTFRWDKDSDGGYTGVAYGKVISVREKKGEVVLTGATNDDYREIWKEYFDLDRDYEAILSDLKGKDSYLDAALEYAPGLKILNQETWEMIISFIISGNNNIPRIKKSIKLISEKFGRLIAERDGIEYYSFPSPEELSLAGIDELRECGVGYRDKYIYETTRLILDGKVNIGKLKDLDTDSARNELKKLSGVGDKIADCILLFSCKKSEAFPVDTWVKKILKKCYEIESKNLSEINSFAREYFGLNCGIAQQFLFHYIRNIKME